MMRHLIKFVNYRTGSCFAVVGWARHFLVWNLSLSSFHCMIWDITGYLYLIMCMVFRVYELSTRYGLLLVPNGSSVLLPVSRAAFIVSLHFSANRDQNGRVRATRAQNARTDACLLHKAEQMDRSTIPRLGCDGSRVHQHYNKWQR